MKKVNKVVIVGGGTAGWMTAASLAKLLGNNFELELVESEQIGTIGVGESTVPTLSTLHQLLKIDERDFVSAVHGTFKLGISFENWRDVDQDYFHSFGWTGNDCWAAGFQHFWLKGRELGISADYGDYCLELMAAKQKKFAVPQGEGLNYAYHIDSGLYASMLRKIANAHGCKRTEGKITQVGTNPDTGFIEYVELESGQKVAGDLFVDCSGFSALLIEKTLKTGYEDWTHWLPCDRAIAVQTEALRAPVPYTRAIARSAGWQWRIPLQSRVGNGYVYSSQFQSDDDALRLLLDNIQGKTLIEPNHLRFRTGQREQHWNKNCVAVCLSSGFIEPLEATSIHLIQRAIIWLMQLFPRDQICQPDIDEFNQKMKHECEHIRDFIILHYHVTSRRDTEFWRYCANMSLPDSLSHRIDLFKETARAFHVPGELFTENSWTQVMLGQGIMPEQYHPIVNMMGNQDLNVFLANIKSTVGQQSAQLPGHQDFIDHYCKAMV
ncbi:MAG: tryptophan 7-halogenase [Gammaproteobacteria bacterium]|nr:tryptophan 7-halogenase [Gammaproteobacteria bacterium]